jgi:DNA repair exonuclease SbcCD ATPase subunit
MSQELRERVERLQNENSSLKQEKLEREKNQDLKLGEMNREINILNLKLQDLERITRERDELKAKLNMLISDNERLETMIIEQQKSIRSQGEPIHRKRQNDNAQFKAGSEYFASDGYAQDQRSYVDRSGRSQRQVEEYYIGEDEFEGLPTGKNTVTEKDSEFMRSSYDIQRPTEDFEDIERKLAHLFTFFIVELSIIIR